MGGEHLKPCAPPVILLTSWGREIGGKLRETTAMSVPQLGGSTQRDWAVIHTRPQMQHTPVTNTLPKNIDLMYTLNCCLISVLCHVNDISHEQRTVCLKGNMCSSSSQRCQICYKIAPHFAFNYGPSNHYEHSMETNYTMFRNFFHIFFSTEGWNVELLAITSGSLYYFLGKCRVFKFLMCHCCWFKCRSVLLQLAPSFWDKVPITPRPSLYHYLCEDIHCHIKMTLTNSDPETNPILNNGICLGLFSTTYI